jgi:hypothetical protein
MDKTIIIRSSDVCEKCAGEIRVDTYSCTGKNIEICSHCSKCFSSKIIVRKFVERDQRIERREND